MGAKMTAPAASTNTNTVPQSKPANDAPVVSEFADLLDRPLLKFSDDTRRIILDTCCGGASKEEAEQLIAIAELRGLNPLAGECHFVQRYDSVKQRKVWSVQTSIDAMRIKAEETGLYDGQDEPEYEYKNPGDRVPVLARVRIYRKDWTRPSVGVARFDEFVQKTREGKPNHMWETMPHNQISKCAEAQAFRKGFPKRLARLYIGEEIRTDDGQSPSEALQEQLGRTNGAPTNDASEALCAQRLAAIAAATTLDALAAAMKGARAGLSAEQCGRLADAATKRKATLQQDGASPKPTNGQVETKTASTDSAATKSTENAPPFGDPAETDWQDDMEVLKGAVLDAQKGTSEDRDRIDALVVKFAREAPEDLGAELRKFHAMTTGRKLA